MVSVEGCLLYTSFQSIPKVALVPGFISSDKTTGDVTNLGRGGSDYTACLLYTSLPREKELARTPQTDNLKTQLSKLVNTPFEAKEIEISFTGNWFLPASVLADFRRQAIDQLITARRINYRQELRCV